MSDSIFFYTIAWVARRLGVTRQTINNWINTKKKGFPEPIVYSPKVKRFPKDQMDAWIADPRNSVPQSMTPVPITGADQSDEVPRETKRKSETVETLPTEPQTLFDSFPEENGKPMVIKEGVNPFDDFNQGKCIFDDDGK